MIARLTDDERRAALAALPHWRSVDGGDAIARTFLFEDFADAFVFMTRVALAAEAMDHHPDWCNSHRRVSVTLTTHRSGGLTELDIALAKMMEDFAAPLLR